MQTQFLEKWKDTLILEIARRKGFSRENLEDAHQKVALIILNFQYDPANTAGASERTVLTSLIEKQLTMILRGESRRKNHVKKIGQICVGWLEKPNCKAHLDHARRFEIGEDVREALARLTPEEREVCSELALGTPRFKVAEALNRSRYEVDRIIDSIAEQFADLELDAWVRS